MMFSLWQKTVDPHSGNNFKTLTKTRPLVCLTNLRRLAILLGLLSLLFVLPAYSQAQAKRVVVVQCDGLP